ncbi:MAG: DDE-type integrase/transposase/recombinase [Pseudomonadota bacterium]
MTRDKSAALRFPKRAMMRYGSPKTVITDCLRSHGAAMKELGLINRQEVDRHLNNRVENRYLPFRRRARAKSRVRRMSNLHKFASTHASFHNHFNIDCHISHSSTFSSMRNAALSE